MKKFFVIAAMVIGSVVTVNAAGNKNAGNIYGTWKSVVDNGTEAVTVAISPNGMTITKVENDGDKKIEMFNSLSYNPKTQCIRAHQYKEIEIENGFQKVEREYGHETYFVKWIDQNHIQIGDHPYEMDGDFGTMTRM